MIRRGVLLAVCAVAAALTALCLSACLPTPEPEPVRPAGDAYPQIDATPPPQELLVPGEMVEGELEEGEIDRWVFASQGGDLATINIWFRPATASGPDAEVQATLVGPGNVELVR